MKKLIIALMVLLGAVAAQAQNANRTGFFIEAAIGGTVGDGPRAALSYDGTNLYEYFASGTAFNIAFGPRVQTSNHVSVDLRFEVQAPFSYLKSVPAAKFMPAIHYTSKELFGNMSLYFTIGIGGAVSANYKTMADEDDWYGDYFDLDPSKVLPADGEKKVLSLSNSPEVSFGPSYLINLGLNVTNHFYAGLMWDGQYMFNQNGKNGKTTCHWGMTGLQIGYRF